MIFSLTWFLRTYFHTHVINLIHILFRSLCPHNISSYTSNHHCLVVIAWVSCIYSVRYMVVGVFISYTFQWKWCTNIQFKMKLISICFYILCFIGFISICIWAPNKLLLVFLLVNFGLYLSKYKYTIIILFFKEMLSCLVRSNFYISLDIFYYLFYLIGNIIHIEYSIRVCQFYISRLLFSTKTLLMKFIVAFKSTKALVCILYTQSITRVFFQEGFLVVYIITRLQYSFWKFQANRRYNFL